MTALKTHQMTRLEHIRNETTKLKLYLDGLKADVTKLEAQRLRDRNEDSEWAQKVTKLREENRALRIECHCLSMEVDLYASGQMPLGVTDPNFYRNIPPGPNGPLLRPNTAPPHTPRLPPSGHPPYPVQQMPRLSQPPTYEESLYYPPPRFDSVSSASSSDILRQVPPAPRPVWLSPTVQQTMRPVSPLAGHSFQRPPQLPPRPNSASPRTPIPSTSTSPMIGAQAPNPVCEDGQKWTCAMCTLENHPALHNCEACEMPRNGCLGISMNRNHIYYTNPVPTVQTLPPHNSTECYCHSCRH